MRKILVVAVAGLFLVAATSASAATYTANFDTDAEGWHGDGENYSATGGQDGGGYYYGFRETAGPYLTPPEESVLYGDVAANLGSTNLTFSYYLKNTSGSPVSGGEVYLFGDADETPGWDTLWLWTPEDTTVPTEWTHYSWTVDTTALDEELPTGWIKANEGPGTWASTWQDVAYWNFWTTGGSNVENGIDTVVVGPAAAGIPGDLDDDGFVGGSDLDIIRSFWGQTVTPGNKLHGDPSGDGLVAGDDLDEVRAHWGEGTPPATAIIPEPSVWVALLGMALAALVATRRRK